MVVVILLIAALVCFLVAAVVGHSSSAQGGWSRTNFVALGLALWVIAELVVAFPRIGA